MFVMSRDMLGRERMHRYTLALHDPVP